MRIEEVRIRWVQTQHKADSIYYMIKELILSGVGSAETKLAMVCSPYRLPGVCLTTFVQILDMITGHTESAKARAAQKVDDTKDYANAKYDDTKDYANAKYDDAKGHANAKYNEASGYANQKADEASGYASEKTAQAQQKKGEYETAGKKYWNEKVEQAQKQAEHAKVEL